MNSTTLRLNLEPTRPHHGTPISLEAARVLLTYLPPLQVEDLEAVMEVFPEVIERICARTVERLSGDPNFSADNVSVR